MTLWIREMGDDEICPRVPFGAHLACPAEALGFTECGPDVGNADVKDHVTVVVDASAHSTRDTSPVAGGVAVCKPIIPRLGDRFRDWSARVELPSEQVAVETPKLLGILSDDLKVYNRLSHGDYIHYLLGLAVRLTSMNATNEPLPLGQLPCDSMLGNNPKMRLVFSS
jgi:hypothetical protein